MKRLEHRLTFLGLLPVVISLVISGCGTNRASLEVTYVQPQGSVGTLTVVGPRKAEVFSHVEVCTPDGWKKAGILGSGWKAPGAHVFSDSLTFSIETTQRVHFRVRSHPHLVGGMVRECTVQTSLVPRPGGRYRSVWELREKSCHLNLAEEMQNGTLVPVQHEELKAPCMF